MVQQVTTLLNKSILITTTNLPISTDSNDFTKSSDFCFRLNSLKLRLEWKTNQKGNKETSIKQNKVKEGGEEVARVFGYLPGKISNNKNNSTFIWLLKYYNFNQKAILSKLYKKETTTAATTKTKGESVFTLVLFS